MGKTDRNSFLLIGISHKTAPIEIRERFLWDDDRVSVVLKSIHEVQSVLECVILCTCNRTEIYIIADKPDDATTNGINRVICDSIGQNTNLLKNFYHKSGLDVIEHLFTVVSGIDSMILGEPEIFGQVKNAYSLACDSKSTGPLLNRLFHQAFRVGKHIRNTTSIGEGAVSVGSAAVALAREHFSTLADRTALLAGAGAIGRLCAKQLVESGIKRLYIANRTLKHAEILARELPGEVIPFESMDRLYHQVDIIITSMTSHVPIITKSHMPPAVDIANGRPLLIIDLGVPRNVEPDVSTVGAVHYYDIDDLENVVLDNQDKRKAEAEKARDIIRCEVDRYQHWLEERDMIPVIQSLREKWESIRLEELGRVRNKVSTETYDVIELVTRRLVRKILHNPTVSIRSSETREIRARLLESVQELFIKDSGNSSEREACK